MPDQKKQTPPRLLSVPLTPEQRASLEEKASGQPLSAYVREQLFAANDNPAPKPRTRGKHPVKDHAALSAALAKLGQSELSSSLRELAKAARLGALPITPETEAALIRACRHVAEIKALLMQALGIKER